MASTSNNRFELHNRTTNGKEMATVYSGKWTVEEERYVAFLCKEFKEGALDIKEGTTLRSFLAEKLGCKAKRITKKYERTGYNGKLQFVDKKSALAPADLQWRRSKLEELKNSFVESREAIMVNELPRSDDRSVMTSALFGGNVPHRLDLPGTRPASGLGLGFQRTRSAFDLPAPASLSTSVGLNAFPGLNPSADLVRASLAVPAMPAMHDQGRLSFSSSSLPMVPPSLEALRAEELMHRELRRNSIDALLLRQEALLRARASIEMDALMRATSGAESRNIAYAQTQTGVHLREEALETLARKKARLASGLQL